MLTSTGLTLSPWPSTTLLSFAQRQVALNAQTPHAGHERRAEHRILLAMPVIVQGVDEQIAPLGEPQPMVVRDYSPRGLGLVHEHPFEHKRIVVQLTYPEDGKILAAEVRWSRALGPFYHLGCEIVAKLKRFPVHVE